MECVFDRPGDQLRQEQLALQASPQFLITVPREHQDGLSPLSEYLTLALSPQHVVGFNWRIRPDSELERTLGERPRRPLQSRTPRRIPGVSFVPAGSSASVPVRTPNCPQRRSQAA